MARGQDSFNCSIKPRIKRMAVRIVDMDIVRDKHAITDFNP